MAASNGGSGSRHRISPGATADHHYKIIAALTGGGAVTVTLLTITAPGRVIDAAVQHFMLYYAGVFALIGLTASVGAGLVSTDRIVLRAGHRIVSQAVHRAVSFGALTFLVIHIITEIVAQRATVLDSVIPFLARYRTFYVGLGTIASDLIVAVMITSMMRKRFTGPGQAWRWRAIHYSAYAAFLFGVIHGLLAGRPAKPYVDWSYGFCLALTVAGLGVRVLAQSKRPRPDAGHPASGQVRRSELGTAALPTPLPLAGARYGARYQELTGATSALAPARVPGPFPRVPEPGPGPEPGTSPSPYEPGYLGPPRRLGAPVSPPYPGFQEQRLPGTAPWPPAVRPRRPVPARDRPDHPGLFSDG